MTETTPKDPEAEGASPPPDTVSLPAAEADDLREKARERDEYLSDLKRVQADFANFQKRNRQEREAWGQTAIQNLVRDLLPALDSFDLAVQACNGVAGMEKFLEGIKLADREVFRVLENQGLKPLETKGKSFDPHEHEVVQVVETSEAPDQTVLDEVRKGYRLGERVLRPAQVRVARAPQAPAEPGD